ncbi:MAG: DUF4261 domain-containing protein [Actinomycetaceae bacterium]|nr:DUF4261 domain-containing protein [Actinomycetaceae bacterium]
MSDTPFQFSASAIHGVASEFLSCVALFNAPINLEGAVERLELLWDMPVRAQWAEVEAEASGGISGSLYHFETPNAVTVMLTPVSGELKEDKGRLPDHRFHVMLTCFAPISDPHTGEVLRRRDTTFFDPITGLALDIDGGEMEENAEGEYVVDTNLAPELQRRRRSVDAHTVMTQMMDMLMREEAAIGVYRPELGVVQPPNMVVELADLLSKGQAPVPLWVGVRTFKSELVNARTLGLPLFGHLDLDVMDSLHSEDDVYGLLSNLADYVITSDQFLMPGHTITYLGDKLTLTQTTSPADDAPVLRIAY